jgi:hypothetical protein
MERNELEIFLNKNKGFLYRISNNNLIFLSDRNAILWEEKIQHTDESGW